MSFIIRDAHERPEVMEEASVMLFGVNAERVMQALKLLNTQKIIESSKLGRANDYSMSKVSDKDVRIITSCNYYIHRVVRS